MATSFDVPQNLFLNKISDRNLINMTPTELEAYLDQLLISSFSWFRKCKNSLEYDSGSRTILADLIDDENEILSLIMVQQWYKPQIKNIDLLKQVLSTREYKIHSQANQLEKLKEDYIEARIEYKQVIREYVDRNTDIADLYA
jgi:hypothetical protein